MRNSRIPNRSNRRISAAPKPEKEALNIGEVLIAKTLYGLEDVLVQELEDLGAKKINKANRAVMFEYTLEMMYRANIELRTALRILKPIAEFDARDTDELLAGFLRIKWEEIMDISQSFAVDYTVNSEVFTHSQYAALRLKDGVCDRFRNKTGGNRPSVDVQNPDIMLNLHISGTRVTVSLDSSGTSLHRRGLRMLQNEAPMSEVLAAGLIKLSGWNGKTPFVDAMCGSGTILLEAAMLATNTAPGLKREQYCFKNFKDFDEPLYLKIKSEAKSKIIKNPDVKICGSDISAKAVELSKSNLESADLLQFIDLKQCDIADLTPPEGPGTLIINPPYGERMMPEDLEALYKNCGDSFKKNFKGYSCWIFSSNNEAFKNVGLKPTRNITLHNGAMECKFRKYEIYAGSKKDQYLAKAE